MGQNTIHSPLNRHLWLVCKSIPGENNTASHEKNASSKQKKTGNFRDFLGWRLHFTKNLPWNPTSIGPSLAPFKVKFPLNSNDVPLSFSGQRAENGGIITSHPPRKGITSPTSYLFDAYWMLVRLVVKASGKTWEMLWCSPKLNNWWAGSSYFFYQPYTVYLFERYVLYCAHIFSARLENLSRACSFKLKKCKNRHPYDLFLLPGNNQQLLQTGNTTQHQWRRNLGRLF